MAASKRVRGKIIQLPGLGIIGQVLFRFRTLFSVVSRSFPYLGIFMTDYALCIMLSRITPYRLRYGTEAINNYLYLVHKVSIYIVILALSYSHHACFFSLCILFNTPALIPFVSLYRF